MNNAVLPTAPETLGSPQDSSNGIAQKLLKDDRSAMPIIYTRVTHPVGLRVAFRLFTGVLAAACLAVLWIAAWLTPSAAGTGTHLQLGLHDCAFKLRTGLPCPSCGYTTAFSWFAHGHLLRSFFTQPMGCVLAVATAAATWIGFYIAFTGRPVHRLFRFVPSRYYLMPFLLFGLLAWGWKIFLTLKGIG